MMDEYVGAFLVLGVGGLCCSRAHITLTKRLDKRRGVKMCPSHYLLTISGREQLPCRPVPHGDRSEWHAPFRRRHETPPSFCHREQWLRTHQRWCPHGREYARKRPGCRTRGKKHNDVSTW